MRWRANPAVLLKDWGEELVVFCETTGNTHLLDHNGAAIFLTLHAAPGELSANELLAQLVEHEAPALPSNNMLQSLDETLEELQHCDLIHRVSP